MLLKRFYDFNELRRFLKSKDASITLHKRDEAYAEATVAEAPDARGLRPRLPVCLRTGRRRADAWRGRQARRQAGRS
jgi:hypothetical protein